MIPFPIMTYKSLENINASIMTESRPINGGERWERKITKRYAETFWSDAYVNFPDCGQGFHSFKFSRYTYVKTYQILHFK